MRGRKVYEFQDISVLNISNDRIVILDMSESGQNRDRLISPSALLSGISLSTGVQSINALAGNLSISGAGNTNVTTGNSSIIVSGATGFLTGYQPLGDYVTTSQTGGFYSSSNPSGFITGVNLSSYATTNYVTGISGVLQEQITTLNSITGGFVLDSETGVFYLASNPSGFITGVDLSNYVTGSVVRPSETGVFLTSGAADLRYVGLTGNQTISGVKTFAVRPLVNGTGVLLSGEVNSATILYNRWLYTGNGALTGFAISGAYSPIEEAYRVTIDYLLQDPISYIVSTGSGAMYFSEAPPSGSEIVIIEQSISGG